MKKSNYTRGFTLAETLIVVAITVVLFGVAFVAVLNHMRSLAQLERDTIAKEILIAAQNHLTSAESQGYLKLETAQYGTLGTEDYDTESEDGKPTDVYHLVVNSGASSSNILELMLPFGSIDETVRAGGNYIIRYQPSSATVLDVFYCPSTQRFSLADGFTESDYSSLMEGYRGDALKSERRSYVKDRAVIGWYGNENAIPVGERLKVPTIEIINAERLHVKVTDYNHDLKYVSLKLIIEGEKSGARTAIVLDQTGQNSRVVPETSASSTDSSSFAYDVILDDITKKENATDPRLHFCQLDAQVKGPFFYGENIKIYAVAYSNSLLTNIAKSVEGTTNSLFGYDKEAGQNVAQISNIRHLENLDSTVSLYTDNSIHDSALQTSDLNWEDFLTQIKGEEPTGSIAPNGVSITFFPEKDISTSASTESDTYKPVTPENTLVYNGGNHLISDVNVDYNGDAGIFGELTGGSVSNLLVYYTEDSTSGIASSAGSAGGLVGSMTGTIVTNCGSTAVVTASGNSGGLIGVANSGTVTACYSAGHTDGKYASYYTDGKADYDADNGNLKNGIYNVISSSGSAGGLIGISTGTGVLYSYSTCSAKGTTAGGFIGNATDVSVRYSYATGLVSGTSAEGAFAGSYSGSASNCLYYEIINERKDNQQGFTYVDPVGGKKSYTGITALDATAQTYNDFSLPSDDASYTWQPAVPNDEALKQYYQYQEKSVYNLKTVKQLVASDPSNSSVVINDDDLVATHYGDWPAPEIFVINVQ